MRVSGHFRLFSVQPLPLTKNGLDGEYCLINFGNERLLAASLPFSESCVYIKKPVFGEGPPVLV